MTTREATELWTAIVAELAAAGLAMPAGWRLEFDKASRRFGLCDYGRRAISLSAKLVALNGEAEVGATIRHEIAHALVGPGHHHDWKWRAMAIRCGDDGRRCYDAKDVVTPNAPWEATCPKCGAIVKKHRAPKLGKQQSCGKCARRFDPERILVFRSIEVAHRAPVVSGTPDITIARIFELRAQGLGYVAIDKAFGIIGKRGWWSWKIVKDNSARNGG
jgi:predicted SprT family Zn-dependent metalloprotease